MDAKRVKKIKTRRGIKRYSDFEDIRLSYLYPIREFEKYSNSETIRLSYLYRMRGVERILNREYGGIGGPRRQKLYIKNRMRRRIGIGGTHLRRGSF